MDSDDAEVDFRVRAAVYDGMMTRGAAPLVDDLAAQLGLAREQVAGSLERLAAGRALVLQRDSREVLMANPFSAVPTPFAVQAAGKLYTATVSGTRSASPPCSAPTRASTALAAAAGRRCRWR